MSIHGRACFILSERQRALYGIKCALRIFLTNMAAHTDGLKNNLTHCKHVPCNTLTHSTNEDLLNIKSAKVILSLVPSLARPIPLKPGTRV